MTAVIVAIALLAILNIALIATGIVTSRRAPTARLVGETIVVHTQKPDDQSIRGVVVAEHADRLVLRDAIILVAEDVQHAIPGMSEIPRDSISWWQRLEARV